MTNDFFWLKAFKKNKKNKNKYSFSMPLQLSKSDRYCA